MIDLLLPKDFKGKIAVAMSGGVDSSVAAYLLKESGYDVFGVTMALRGCNCDKTSEIAVIDAKKVADFIGIKHVTVDASEAFKKEIIGDFVSEYMEGKTPSPCIRCNHFIKFGFLFDEIKKLGAEIVITGHYAEIKQGMHGFELHKGADIAKDQSYFLQSLTKEQISTARFPLSSYSKDEIRKIAHDTGLPVASKPDSQDICFVPSGDYVTALSSMGAKTDVKGDIVHVNGQVLGEHNGVVNYTVGQRRGLGIGGGDPLYVTAINADKNQVIVGGINDLSCKKVLLGKINWLGDDDIRDDGYPLMVKLRSRHKEVPARLYVADDDAYIILDEPQKGVAPGQGCAFYDCDRLLGGAKIIKGEEISQKY